MQLIQAQVNIECILYREGGTRVTIDNTEYHFAPQADGAHVAGVSRDDHVARFLSISDAYRLYRGQAKPAEAPAVAIAKVLPLTPQPESTITFTAPVAAPAPTSSMHPDSFTIGGSIYTLAEVAESARDGLGMSAEDWAELSDETRAEFIDERLDALAAASEAMPPAAGAPAPTDAEQAEKAERAELAAKFKAKFGKNPHYTKSNDAIREALAE